MITAIDTQARGEIKEGERIDEFNPLITRWWFFEEKEAWRGTVYSVRDDAVIMMEERR